MSGGLYLVFRHSLKRQFYLFRSKHRKMGKGKLYVHRRPFPEISDQIQGIRHLTDQRIFLSNVHNFQQLR